MKIIESQKYKQQLKKIAFYIRKDKLSASVNFVTELKKSIKDSVNFPYKHRKSIYYDDEAVRDMIFKGYTIIYEIFDDKIEIMTIFNQNKPSKKKSEDK